MLSVGAGLIDCLMILSVLISACGGWRLISAIVHSLLPVLNVGTVSLLLSAWLTQWTLLKPSLKLICSLRLTLI